MIWLCKIYPLLAFVPWLILILADYVDIGIPTGIELQFYIIWLFFVLFLLGMFFLIKYFFIDSRFRRPHQWVGMILALLFNLFGAVLNYLVYQSYSI